MARTRRLLFAVILVAAFAVVAPRPAMAACHIFTVSASPAAVVEGGSLTVTVTRDAGLAESSIEVYSENQSAVAGQDFPAVSQRVSMANDTSETSKSFTIGTTNDAAPEANETFLLKMRNPGGCAVNPNFNFSDTAQVTIQDNDAAPPPPASATAPPARAAPPPTARTTTTTVPATTTTTVVAETTTTADSTTTSDVGLAAESTADSGEGDGGGAGAALLVLVAVVLVGGVGYVGYVLYRRRPA